MRADTTYINDWRAGGEHDYFAEIKDSHTEVPDIDVPTGDIGSIIDSPATKFISSIIAICVLGYFVYRMYTRFVSDRVKGSSDIEGQGLGNDTIYGHDWRGEIARMMHRGRYGEVVVLCYLHMLNELNDLGVIEFRQSKTPGMLLGEITSHTPAADAAYDMALITDKARTLTADYLKIRYGHRSVTAGYADHIINNVSLLTL